MKRSFWHSEKLGGGYKNPDDVKNVDESKANLVGSSLEPWGPSGVALHAPVIDIDFAAELIPSSTPGHFHLYLDKHMTWKEYEKLLKCLRDVGIIEEGYYKSAIKMKQTFVRKPGIPKDKIETNPMFRIRLQEIAGMIGGLIQDSTDKDEKTTEIPF